MVSMKVLHYSVGGAKPPLTEPLAARGFDNLVQLLS